MMRATTTPRVPNRRDTAVLGAACALTILAILPPLAVAGGPSDPPPVFDVGGDEKCFRALVSFSDRETATLEEVSVDYGFARGRLGNPPLLRVHVLDRERAVLQEFNEWHPLWEFRQNDLGTESRVILSSGLGELFFPFDREAAVLELTDVALDEGVLSGDLTGAVRAFCTGQPDDPDCEVADLEVVSVEAVDAPPFVLFGQPVDVTVRTTLENHGPAAPVDALLERDVATDAGLLVAPVSGEDEVTGLALDDPTAVDTSYRVECLAPGRHGVSFTSGVDPLAAAVVDLAPDNDKQTLDLVVDCAVPVAINIKPESLENPLQLRRGTVPVAFLTTVAGEYGLPLPVDATAIDPASVRFGEPDLVRSQGGGARSHGHAHIEDSFELDELTLDGDLDQVLHFKTAQAGLLATTTTACARGVFSQVAGGASFFGCDSVQVLTGGSQP